MICALKPKVRGLKIKYYEFYNYKIGTTDYYDESKDSVKFVVC